MNTAAGLVAALFGAGVGVGWSYLAVPLASRCPEAEEQPGWTRTASGPLPLALLGAVVCGAAGLRFGAEPELAPALLLCAVLVGVIACDLRYRVIPHRLIAPAAIAGYALAVAVDPGRWLELLVAALLAGGFLLVAAIASPGGLGFGDVTLVTMLGLYLGSAVAPAVVAGLLLSLVPVLGFLIVRGRAGRKSTFALGPFLAAGGIVGLLAGQDIIDWYLRSSGA